MQPYQQASEEIQRQNDLPVNALKKGANLAINAGSFGIASTAAKRILPLLSKYVPEAFATKALTKLNPSLGKFISGAKQDGSSFEEIQNFIKNKVTGEDEKESEKEIENPKESRNIIEKYDPELHTYILQKIKKGDSLINAGKQALTHGRFKKAIDKMTKDYKTSWDKILETIYGQSNQAKQQEQPDEEQIMAQMQQQAPEASQEQQSPQEQQGPQAPQGPQAQSGGKLMALLQALKGLRGQ